MYSSVRDRPATPPAGDTTSGEGHVAGGDRPRIGRNVWFLGLTSLITDISSEMVNAILPLYLIVQIGFSPVGFGLFDGAYQGMTGVLRIAGGLVADRRRRYKEVAAAGYACSAAAKLGLLVSSAWVPTTGVLLLDRTGKGVRTAPRDALISLSSAPARLAESFGVHRALDTAGALLGPILAFHLLTRVRDGYDVVFVFSFCIALIGLGVLCFFVKNRTADMAGPSPAPAPAPAPAATRPSLRTAAGLLRVPEFRRLVVVGAGLGLVTVSDAFIYLMYQRRSGMEPTAFPLLFVGTALAYLLLAVPAGRLADRIGRAPVFLAGYVLLAGCYVVLGQASGGLAVRMLLLGLLGAYYASTDGVLMALASATVPEALRTSGLALLTTVTATARLVASVLFGVLWTWRGIDSAATCFLVALVVALPVAAVVLGRNRPAGPGVSPEMPGGPGASPEGEPS